MRPHPRRARTNPTAPEAWGTCDRSGFIAQQRDLQWQFEWAGTQLINKRVLVARDMWDEPNRQLGTIILPPDPVSIMNARPEPYYIDEQTFRIEEGGQQRYQMDGTARIESNKQSSYLITAVNRLEQSGQERYEEDGTNRVESNPLIGTYSL